jgi:ribosomal protein L19
LAKSQLLGKLLATKATGQPIEESEDPMMDQLLATRYKAYNSAGISIRTTGWTRSFILLRPSSSLSVEPDFVLHATFP